MKCITYLSILPDFLARYQQSISQHLVYSNQLHAQSFAVVVVARKFIFIPISVNFFVPAFIPLMFQLCNLGHLQSNTFCHVKYSLSFVTQMFDEEDCTLVARQARRCCHGNRLCHLMSYQVCKCCPFIPPIIPLMKSRKDCVFSITAIQDSSTFEERIRHCHLISRNVDFAVTVSGQTPCQDE